MRFPFSIGGRSGIWYCLQSLLASPHVLHRRGVCVVVSFAFNSAGAEMMAGASTALSDGVAATVKCSASTFSVAGGSATVIASEAIGPK